MNTQIHTENANPGLVLQGAGLLMILIAVGCHLLGAPVALAFYGVGGFVELLGWMVLLKS